MRSNTAGQPIKTRARTFARRVAEHTGFRIITTGEMFRTIAAEKGVSVTELNQMAESDFDIDKQVDDFLVSLNDVEEDLVLDSRMAFPGSPVMAMRRNLPLFMITYNA